MEEYLKQILIHLPIQFADKEANEFVEYLSEAYTENLEKEKYQFAFTAFHMLNMIFIYKVKWFLKEQGNQGIVNALNNKNKLSFNNLFDLSQFNEKESLELLLQVLKFQRNDFTKCRNHVDARNHCSHASGKIEYNKKGIDFLIDDEIKYIERLQKRIKPELEKFLQNFLNKNWQQTFISGDFKNLFEEKYFSLKDLELISIVDLPLFRKKSDNEENIKQKILYLLLIFEIQNKIESDENLFLKKLPIFMIDIPDEIVKVKKDNDENDKMYASEIIEEFLMPIISNFSDEDRIKAEKILKLGE